jgi:hypothetical protein
VIPFDRVPPDPSAADLRSTDLRTTDLRDAEVGAGQEVVGLGEAAGMPATAGARSTSASDSGR